MRYSQLFPKTLRTAPSGAESINHQLLVRAGFMDQLMAGSWTLLPLGLRVVTKINNIIREELNTTGAQELAMPLLHPREIWDQTGRWSDPAVQEIMYQFKDVHNKEFGLSFTHEEILMNLLGKYIQSYKDLPAKLYQFSTKFRNEPRAKSGILRGREFLMKDLYSAHTTEEDMMAYYEQVKDAYVRIFDKIGLKVKVTEAAGGVFTKNVTHEFQVLTPVGEDTVFYCDKCDFCQNQEIFEGKEGDKCPKCDGTMQSAKSIEVGNIFPLGTKYAENQGVFYQNESGEKKPVWFASYGIGPTRVMGTLVEVFHDDKGIVWPESVAPYAIHLVGLDGRGEELYKELTDRGVEVLFDDRPDVSAGQKFADADLIGLPVRVVVSNRTGDQVEVKRRDQSEAELVDPTSL